MMKTWLILLAVRNPVLLEVISRISSSVCRLPFIRSSPLPSWIKATAFAAAISGSATSTISQAVRSRPCLRAIAEMAAAGPTRIGRMMPASAASNGPRSAVSSHGEATIVFGGTSCLARAISRSYFETGGSPTGASAAIVPISPTSSPSMTKPPPADNCELLCGELRRLLRSGMRHRKRFAAGLEQPRHLIQPFRVLAGHLAPCAEHRSDQSKRHASCLCVGRQHGWYRGERGVAVDEQNIELFADQLLESGERHIAVRLSNAPHRLKPALVDGAPTHSGIDEPANNRGLQPADCDTGAQLGDTFGEQLAMQKAFVRSSERLPWVGVDTQYRLKKRRAVHRDKDLFRGALVHFPPAVERGHDIGRHGLLEFQERVIRRNGLARLAHLLGHLGDRSHGRIGVGEKLVLQAERMAPPQQVRDR